jgi:hypothetical protein
MDLLDKYDLRQHCNKATHINGHILDLVITRTKDNIVKTLDIIDLQISDHFPIFASLDISKPNIIMKSICHRNLKSININKFMDDVHTATIKIKDNSVMSDITLEYVRSISAIINRHAPMKQKYIEIRAGAPWFNNDIKHAKTIKRRAERKWLNNKIVENKVALKLVQKVFTKQVRDAKSNYYISKIKESGKNTKKLFRTMNTLISTNTSNTLPTYDDESIMAETFADYFIDKIITIRASLPLINRDTNHSPHFKISCNSQFTSFEPVTELELNRIIMSMSSTTCDLDPLPTNLLKTCITAFVPVLTFIVNMSLSSENMPICLKMAIILPLIKKLLLNREILTNYRPISNLAFLSKVIEKCVALQLVNYMNENNLCCKWQSAYRQYHSTETALLRVLNDIYLKIENKHCVALILLDLSAAFDTIDRTILLERLNHYYGVSGKALGWISSYLTNRSQAVKINTSTSSYHTITSGVPQGSVLGPLLFSLYTAPMGQIIQSHGLQYHLYADDTQLYFSFDAKDNHSIDHHLTTLKACLKDIAAWMATNYLKLNENKTEITILGSPQVLKWIGFKSVEFGNTIINTSKSVSNIGATIDSSLSMNEHINKLCRTCYMHIRNIWRIRENLDKHSTKLLVHALIISRLDNLNSLYISLPKYQIAKLQKVQNSAARVIHKLWKHCHITSVLQQLHWLPIDQRIHFKILTLVYKCINNQAPEYLKELIHKYEPKRDNLRSNNTNMLTSPMAKSSYGNRSFSIAAPKLWNTLPTHIRTIASITSFKTNLKTHLFNKYYNIVS